MDQNFTDHKSTELFYTKKSRPPTCTEHWVLCIQTFDYTFWHKPRSKSIADAPSELSCCQYPQYAQFWDPDSHPKRNEKMGGGGTFPSQYWNMWNKEVHQRRWQEQQRICYFPIERRTSVEPLLTVVWLTRSPCTQLKQLWNDSLNGFDRLKAKAHGGLVMDYNLHVWGFFDILVNWFHRKFILSLKDRIFANLFHLRKTVYM